MPKHETITLTLQDETVVTVVLRSSNVGDAAFHTQRLAEGSLMKYDGTQDTANLKHVGTYLYPHCVACVESPVNVRELLLADFMLLDEREIDAWAAASEKLNRHWWQSQADYVKKALQRITDTLTEPDQKKTGTLSSGSQNSTTEMKPKTRPSRRSKS